VAIRADGVATTVPGEHEAGSVNLDFDRDGRLLGIEVLAASRWLPREVIEQASPTEPSEEISCVSSRARRSTPGGSGTSTSRLADRSAKRRY